VRFWITKNSEIPVRDQIVRQVILGILSADLTTGQKLPSTRALARRYKIHPNTASAAYHALCTQGWLELRRGSGLYVRGIPEATATEDLTTWLHKMLAEARQLGYHSEEVFARLKKIIEPERFTEIVILEPDHAMGEILREELQPHLSISVRSTPINSGFSPPPGALFIALPTRVPLAQAFVPAGATLLTIRLRSVSGSLATEKMPPPNTLIVVASRSAEFRNTAIQVLLAAGIPSLCLSQIDPAMTDPAISEWQDRVSASTIAIVDAVVARELSSPPNTRLFRIVADECLTQLREMTDSA
jgi:DNA-binding transcriptional regulator YhcF (GntR family)